MFVRSALICSLLALFALSFSSAGHAQATDGGLQIPAGPAGDAIARRNREVGLRSITMMGANKRDPREQQALLEQMNDDFKHIQVIRLRMVDKIAAGKPFEYKQLSEDAAEIRKRSARLRSLLALKPSSGSQPATPASTEYGKDTIQDAASDLCLEISRFITNPLFKPNAVYNPRYATEADNSLQTIIAISENINSSADTLRHSIKEH
jgi:hypothetical protein